MEAYLALSQDRRAILCEQAGDELGMPPGAIEKDFWVCWVLREMFRLDVGPSLAFKGGTSLSKCYGIIDRFSEDIDLVVERGFLGFDGDAAPEVAHSGNERNRRLDRLKAACSDYVGTSLLPSLRAVLHEQVGAHRADALEMDQADPSRQTILVPYETALRGSDYVRPVVKIELGARSDVDPNERRTIEPYLTSIPAHELGDCRVDVRVVAAERTFWEKVCLLHEASYRDGAPRARLARHYYDLWCLDKKGVAARAIADGALFDRVVEHRRIYFRLSGPAQSELRRGSVRLMPSLAKLPAWESDYTRMRGTMFVGEPPRFAEILKRMLELESRINGAPSAPRTA